MKERFAFHSFGHHEGRYQTIDALGIFSTEAKPLEQFFFGQTNNDAYLASLQEAPGIIWRTVGDRGALTRVRQGESDAHGRDTLRFETLLIEKPQFKTVVEHLAQVVIAQWDTNPDGVLVSFEAAQGTAVIHAERVSEVVMAVRGGKRVVHRADEFGFRDVAKIIGACGGDPSFSLCFKSLNKAAPVTVNLLSLESVEKSMTAPQLRTPKETPPRPQPAAPKRVPAQSSPWMLGVVCLVLVVQSVMFWVSARSRSDSGESQTGQNDLMNRIESLRGDDREINLATLRKEQEERINKLESTLKELQENRIGRVETLIDSVQRELKQAIESESDRLELSKTKEEISNLPDTISVSVDKRLAQPLWEMEKRMKELVTAELNQLKELLSKAEKIPPMPDAGPTGENEARPQK